MDKIGMICPRCKIAMGKGLGINPTRPDRYKNALGGPEVLIDHTMLKLDEVWKCHSCGHSADINK